MGDNKPRYRPEQVRAMRVSRCTMMAAGNRHSMAVSEAGLLLTFGAGGAGQLGSGGIAESQLVPQVVDALRDVGKVTHICCGNSHSVAVVWDEDAGRQKIFAWGAGGCGQLGLPKSSLEPGLRLTNPQKVQLPEEYRKCPITGIFAGPLANHTVILLGDGSEAVSSSGGCAVKATGGYAADPQGQVEPSGRLPAQSTLRSAISVDSLMEVMRRSLESNQDQNVLAGLLGQAFSSASVLNASFRKSGQRSLTITPEDSGLDLFAVRFCFQWVHTLGRREVVETMGRATLSLCEELSRSSMRSNSQTLQAFPAEEPESLCVFLVLFENPLLLAENRTSLFPGYHVAVAKLLQTLLALPDDSRKLLFGWLARLPSEYFARVVLVIEQYITFVLTQGQLQQSDANPAILFLQILHRHNEEEGGIIPSRYFQSSAVSSSAELREHYERLKNQGSAVFSFCRYPFLLDADAKRRLLAFDSQLAMEMELQTLRAIAMRSGDPAEALQIIGSHYIVRRARILEDFMGQVCWKLRNMPSALLLPMSVDFHGEAGVDAGGLRKEALQLVLKELTTKTQGLLFELEDLRGCLWFDPLQDTYEIAQPASNEGDELGSPEVLGTMVDPSWREILPELFGLVVGLAAHNGILVDLRLHPLVYEFLANPDFQPAFSDLRRMHPSLFRSLQAVLAASDQELNNMGLTFSVALPGSPGKVAQFDLVPNGEEVLVTASNRNEFARLYADAALRKAIEGPVEQWCRGVHRCLKTGLAFGLCSAEDLELLVCGSDDIGDLSDLQKNAAYANGYQPEHPTVRLFWEMARGFPERLKRRLLHFCTGSDRVPIGGLGKTQLMLRCNHEQELDHLPTASTCINQVNMPPYPTIEMMTDRWTAALNLGVTGFGFA